MLDYLNVVPWSEGTALLAIWLTLHEMRRNSRNVVRLQSARCWYTSDFRRVNRSVLRLRIRNEGLPIHNAQVSIRFYEPGMGTMDYGLRHVTDETGPMQEFTRGMIADFEIDDDHSKPVNRRYAEKFGDPRERVTKVIVRSQGDIVATFKVGGIADRLKCWWNGIAGNLEIKLGRELIAANGEKQLKLFRLPKFRRALSWEFHNFARSLHRRASEQAEEAAKPEGH